jgi:hypothetical protein
VGLVIPRQELFDVVHTAEEQFRLNFDEMSKKSNIADSLFKLIHPLCDFTCMFSGHPEHALYVSEKIIKMYIVMRIFYALKFSNTEHRKVSSKPGQSARRSAKARKMQKILHEC